MITIARSKGARNAPLCVLALSTMGLSLSGCVAEMADSGYEDMAGIESRDDLEIPADWTQLPDEIGVAREGLVFPTYRTNMRNYATRQCWYAPSALGSRITMRNCGSTDRQQFDMTWLDYERGLSVPMEIRVTGTDHCVQDNTTHLVVARCDRSKASQQFVRVRLAYTVGFWVSMASRRAISAGPNTDVALTTQCTGKACFWIARS